MDPQGGHDLRFFSPRQVPAFAANHVYGASASRGVPVYSQRLLVLSAPTQVDMRSGWLVRCWNGLRACPLTVAHPSANRVRCRAAMFITTNACSPLSQTATFYSILTEWNKAILWEKCNSPDVTYLIEYPFIFTCASREFPQQTDRHRASFYNVPSWRPRHNKQAIVSKI